jgi:hypothetical protein
VSDTLEPPPRLAWPKYVLAAVFLFLVICVTWTWKEARRLQRARQDAMPPGAPASAPATNRSR